MAVSIAPGRALYFLGLLAAQGMGLMEHEGPVRGPWLVVESGPILVYYTTGQEATAREVALYARDAYEELIHAFDFRPEGQVALRLHPTPYSYAQTRRVSFRPALAPLTNLAEVVRLSDKAAFIGQVRAQIAALFLMQFYYGSGARFQNRTLLYLPDWFLWGFAFFWGEGWEVADRARLIAENSSLLQALWERRANPSPAYRSLYKAIWYWLYRTYGQKKLIDLLYMVRLTRQVSEAVYLTLNISEEELTQRWMEFVEELRRGLWEEVLSLEGLSLPAVWGAAVSKRGEVAYASWKEGRVRYTYISPEGERLSLPGGFRWPRGSGYYEVEVPMAYSSGGQLAWVSYTPRNAVVWVWSPAGGQARAHPLSLKGISGLAWRDEESLFLTGWEDGEAQVYELNVRQDRLQALTRSAGDKKEVFWTGHKLYYFWQADSLGRTGYREVWQPFGWAEGAGGWVQRDPIYDWGGGWLKRGDTLVSARNLAGWWRAWVIMADTMYPSQWSNPAFLRWIGGDEQRAYFLYYHLNGTRRIGSLAWDTLLRRGDEYPDVYAAERVQMRLQRLSRYPVPEPRREASQVTETDTAVRDTLRKSRGTFYYFDEEVERPRRRPRRFAGAPQVVRGRYFYPESVVVRYAGQAPPQGFWQGIALVPVLHPLMRLGLHLHTGVETFTGRYYLWGAWGPYADFRSSEFWLGFEKRTGFWQPYGQVHRQMHYFSQSRYGQGLRVQSWWGEAGVRRVISPVCQAAGALLFLYGRRYDLILRDQVDYGAEASWVGGRLEVAYRKLSYRETFLWRGRSLVVRGESFRRGSLSGLGLLMAEGSWHQPLGRWLVLDLMGQAALSSRANSRYFLLGGIPNWINYEVQNRAQLPLLGPVGGYYLNTFVSLPGYPYHARRGRYLLLSSAALRIPLLAVNPPRALPTRTIYTVEWKVAFYAATTWSTGNPFSQKNPIDAEYIYRPPLVISVQTLRSPYLLSLGSSLTFRVMGLPIELGLYWPIEELRVGRPRLLLGFQQLLP